MPCVVMGREMGAVTVTVDTTASLRQRVLTGTYGGSILILAVTYPSSSTCSSPAGSISR